MRDWRQIVVQRLTRPNLSKEEGDAVVEELAAHLEAVYRARLAEGAPEREAFESALRLVPDWKELSLKICEAKNEEGTVNYRTKSFWIPGLINFTGSMVWLMILQNMHWRPAPSLLRSGPPLMPYLIWLITLPLFGALGAYLSRRAGGEGRTRLAAGMFPAMAMLGLMFFVAVFALFIERNPFVWHHPIHLALGVFPWTIFPGAALAIGVLPFLKVEKRFAS